MEPFAVVAAVIREPNVIGAADRGAELKVEIAAPHNVKAEGGKKNADIHSLAVHVADVRWGVEFRCQRVCKGLAPALGCSKGEAIVFLFYAGPHAIGIGNRFSVDGTAGLVGSFDFYTTTKLLRQIFRK